MDKRRPSTSPATAAQTADVVEYESIADPASSETGVLPRHDPYAAFRIPVYRIFVCTFVLAVVASQTFATAIQWDLYRRTGNELYLSVLAAIQAIPVLLFVLPAGHLADIYPRKRILMITQALLVVCPAGIALLIFGYRDSYPPAWMVFALVLLNSISLAFGRPARAALLPQLLTRQQFASAAVWNSSAFELASIVGPAIGGAVIALWGVPAALVLSAGSMLVCFVLTALLPNPAPATSGEPVNLRSLVAGVRFVGRTRLMLATMTLDLFAVLLGGATFLLPVYATKILNVDAAGFGWLRAAPSIGAVVMALVLAHRPPMKHAGRALLLAVAGFGLATIVFGLSRNFWLSMAMLFFTGVFDNISVVVRHTLVQLLTPDAMRGRVSAVNQVFIGASNELGGLESTLVARFTNPVFSVVSGGVGTLIVVAVVSVLWPQVRRLRTLHDVKPEPVK